MTPSTITGTSPVRSASRNTTPIRPRQPLSLPLSHESFAFAVAKVAERSVELRLGNSGPQALQLAVHCHHLPNPTAARHDLLPGQYVSVDVQAAAGIYDIAVHGPNGFLRTITGDMASTLAGFDASLTIAGPASSPALLLQLRNADRITRMLNVTSRIGPAASYRLAPDSSQEVRFLPLEPHDGWRTGWYDLSVTVEGVSSFSRRFAGLLTSAV